MENLQTSPISQLLNTLGITREDLNKRSHQMRQFLTAENSPLLRAFDHDSTSITPAESEARSSSRASTSTVALVRSRSYSSSTSLRDASPPATPVKLEPTESGPLRHFDSMEMVIERKSRQNKREKKVKKEKDVALAGKGRLLHARSPSAGSTNFNLDSFMRSRDDRRVSSTEVRNDMVLKQEEMSLPPVTPQQGRYYREHTHDSSSSRRVQNVATPRAESPTPVRYRKPPQSKTPTLKPLFGFSAPSIPPVTPAFRRVHASSSQLQSSPLPSSSPPPASSPFSTPTRVVVNLVSSPGPMGPLPLAEDYDKLPYTLPPGPYSTRKPDQSYAALIGQAILSSPEHRLTLQEIYDWITIVYPHFKREELTWMNSIRHVLSTTVCFRKVTRDRSIGRTLWAIWDEDLECFQDGGFKKQLCKDMQTAASAKDKDASKKVGKARGKKRAASEETPEGSKDAEGYPKPKRIKKEKHPLAHTQSMPTYILPAVYALPMYPMTGPTPNHQPYYQAIPPEIMFPPLPHPNTYRHIASSASSSASTSQEPSQGSKEAPLEAPAKSPPRPTHSASSSVSIPDLSPSRSSSSPVPPLLTSEIVEGGAESDKNTDSAASDSVAHLLVIEADDGGDELPLLDEARRWEDPQENAIDALEPGITLLNHDYGYGNEQAPSQPSKKAKGKRKVPGKKVLTLPPMPPSPTLGRKAALKISKSTKGNSASEAATTIARTATPPPMEPPSTPPRTNRNYHISATRTPLSHKGLHMSPSPSLAHYKSNLNPPPAASFGCGDEGADEGNVADEIMRTPSRKRTISDTGIFLPVTPKRLVYPTSGDSPFRTPSGMGISPFRTPGSRGIFDPHDPSSLLDDEISRLGAKGDSPDGLFGRGHGALLYESPTGLDTSPGKWSRWY